MTLFRIFVKLHMHNTFCNDESTIQWQFFFLKFYFLFLFFILSEFCSMHESGKLAYIFLKIRNLFLDYGLFFVFLVFFLGVSRFLRVGVQFAKGAYELNPGPASGLVFVLELKFFYFLFFIFSEFSWVFQLVWQVSSKNK